MDFRRITLLSFKPCKNSMGRKRLLLKINWFLSLDHQIPWNKWPSFSPWNQFIIWLYWTSNRDRNSTNIISLCKIILVLSSLYVDIEFNRKCMSSQDNSQSIFAITKKHNGLQQCAPYLKVGYHLDQNAKNQLACFCIASKHLFRSNCEMKLWLHWNKSDDNNS